LGCESVAAATTTFATTSGASALWRAVGRDADDIKYLAFAGFTVGRTQRAALDRRRALDDRIDLRGPLARLAATLGLGSELTRPDAPLSDAQLASLRVRPEDPRSRKAGELARAGWSPRDMLAHAVLDPTPVVVGTADQIADFLEEWIVADAADGFVASFDDYGAGIAAFGEHVTPVLRERGLVADAYRGATLREHLGLRPQHGLDPRLAPDA